MSETFCVYPWIHAYVGPEGDISPCCFARESGLDDADGKRLNMDSHTFEEAWNSDAMRTIRKQMVAGREVDACRHCYHKERLGAESARTIANSEWLSRPGFTDDLDVRLRESEANDFRVDAGLASLDVHPSNACNLGCRMCGPDVSSRLANDKVYLALRHLEQEGRGQRPGRPRKASRFADGRPWFEQPELILNELIRDPGSLRKVYLAGGEPLTNSTVEKIVDLLVDSGNAHQVDVAFSTNLTVLNERLFAKLAAFQSTRFFASIDGIGRTYDYLRYPATWTTVEANLERMRAFPHIQVELTPTVQNCNAMDITELMQFAESAGFPYSLRTLDSPDYLSIHAMPQSARDLAVARIVAFTAESKHVRRHAHLASTIRALLADFKQPAPRPYLDLMAFFNTFTSDLDASRGQSFAESCPELCGLVIQDGYDWKDESTFPTPDAGQPAVA